MRRRGLELIGCKKEPARQYGAVATSGKWGRRRELDMIEGRAASEVLSVRGG